MNEFLEWTLRAFLALGFFAFIWYGSIATHSLLLHRFTTHRQFSMSKKVQRILHFLYWVFNGPCYLSPVGYAIMHTLHHLFPDQKGRDPHTPRDFKSWIAYLWHTWKEYDASNTGKKDDVLRLHTGKKPSDFPMWHELDMIAQFRIVRIAWIFLYAYIYYLILPNPVVLLCVSPLFFITCFMGPFHGFLVNWFAHKTGYRNFATDDDSRNVLRRDWLLLGELLHNNHHNDKTSHNFEAEEGEVDPLGRLIYFLAEKKIVELPLRKVA